MQFCQCLRLLVLILNVSLDTRMVSILPMVMGVSEFKTRFAFWSSWADTRPMNKEKHPEIIEVIVYHLERPHHRVRVQQGRLSLNDGFAVQFWFTVAAELRRPVTEVEVREPRVPCQSSWQH